MFRFSHCEVVFAEKLVQTLYSISLYSIVKKEMKNCCQALKLFLLISCCGYSVIF